MIRRRLLVMGDRYDLVKQAFQVLIVILDIFQECGIHRQPACTCFTSCCRPTL